MKLITCLVAALILSLNVNAATKHDVTMDDSIEIAGKTLVLNGLGTRKATWLKVKVYVGGLYLSNKAASWEDIAKQPNPKKLIMHFVRDVDSESLIDGWNTAFKDAVPAATLGKIQPRIGQFNALMRDIKKNERIVITFNDNATKVEVGTDKVGSIKGKDFGDSLLSVWFVNPRDENLAMGLLGKK